MGERVVLEGVHLVWNLLKKEIEENKDKYCWLQKASPKEWIRKIEKFTSTEWASKKEHVEREEFSFCGLETVTLKNRNSFHEYVCRVSKGLLRRRVDWMGHGNLNESSGEGVENDCLISINTSGAPAIVNVTIGPCIKRKRPSSSKEKEPKKKKKHSLLSQEQVAQVHSALDSLDSRLNLNTPPINTNPFGEITFFKKKMSFSEKTLVSF